MCLTRLVPLLHKYSFLWTKPRLLQCDVIVQVGELPSGKVGDEFEAFIRVTFGLDVSYQGLEVRESNIPEVRHFNSQYSLLTTEEMWNSLTFWEIIHFVVLDEKIDTTLSPSQELVSIA